MTTAVGLICQDGLVIGTDMKVTAGHMKYRESKMLTSAKIGKRTIIIAGAGSLRHVNDAISWMQLDKSKDILGDNPTFDDFLGRIVENALPKFASDYQDKYGDEPDVTLIIGAVDKDGMPHLVQIYGDGEYDHRDTFSAIGSGSIFGEILLRKLYYSDMAVDVAKRLVGYLI